MLGVFIIGFGAPQSLDEIGSFLERVAGRKPSEEAIAAARKRYELIGGLSPFLEITSRQAAALETSLARDGLRAKTFIAMRHSPPSMAETIHSAMEAGIEKAVLITLAPQFSAMSVGKYLELFDEAYNEAGASFEVKKIRSYGLHPLFLDAVAEMLRRGKARLAPCESMETTPVIFSAHSLPCGGGFETRPYVEELELGVDGIKKRLGLQNACLAFQSKGGGPFEWLGPTVGEAMEKIAAQGHKTVVLSPIGFVSDHVETLYDLDILAKEKAQSLSMKFIRAPSLNDSPPFIKLLAELAKENA